MDRPMHRPERGLPRDPAMKEFVGARRGQGGRAANGCAASTDPCSRQRRPSGPNPLVQPLRKREGPPSKISRCWPARRWSAYGASLSFERFPAKDGHPPSRSSEGQSYQRYLRDGGHGVRGSITGDKDHQRRDRASLMRAMPNRNVRIGSFSVKLLVSVSFPNYRR